MSFPFRYASIATSVMGRYFPLPYVQLMAASGQAVLTPHRDCRWQAFVLPS
jgi:hypothetical protein